MNQPPPAPSDVLRQEILDAMDPPDRVRVGWLGAAGVPAGVAAVWFTNNRQDVNLGKRVRVARRGSGWREIELTFDVDTSGVEPAYISFIPRTPPFGSMREVAAFILDYLLGR